MGNFLANCQFTRRYPENSHVLSISFPTVGVKKKQLSAALRLAMARLDRRAAASRDGVRMPGAVPQVTNGAPTGHRGPRGPRKMRGSQLFHAISRET